MLENKNVIEMSDILPTNFPAATQPAFAPSSQVIITDLRARFYDILGCISNNSEV
jgi:hypothetical protein